MRCVSCGQQGLIIDLEDNPVFIEQSVRCVYEDATDPDNHRDYILQVNADRAFGNRGNRRLQICKSCFEKACFSAVAELFNQFGLPRVIEGDKK